MVLQMEGGKSPKERSVPAPQGPLCLPELLPHPVSEPWGPEVNTVTCSISWKTQVGQGFTERILRLPLGPGARDFPCVRDSDGGVHVARGQQLRPVTSSSVLEDGRI